MQDLPKFANKTTTFSIVLATYNVADTLQIFLDSYAAQTWGSRELIIVDGASDDGTVEIIKANTALISRWISEPDEGIYDAWNKAIAMCSGTWINFIGADDTFADERVLENVNRILENDRRGELFAYGHVDLIDESGRVYENFGLGWDVAKQSLEHEMSVPHQGMFHHRDLFVRYDGFDKSFKIAGDYDFLLRITRSEIPLYLDSATIVRKKRGGVSMDLAKAWQLTKEGRQAQRNNACFGHKAKIKFILNTLKSLIFYIFGRTVAESLVDLFRIIVLHRPPRFR